MPPLFFLLSARHRRCLVILVPFAFLFPFLFGLLIGPGLTSPFRFRIPLFVQSRIVTSVGSIPTPGHFVWQVKTGSGQIAWWSTCDYISCSFREDTYVGRVIRPSI